MTLPGGNRPLGRHQARLLRVIARPGCALVVADRLSRSLCARGLAQEAGPGSFVHITADGLRRLAAEADAGRLQLAPDLPERKDADE